jgi:hypothetical protein
MMATDALRFSVATHSAVATRKDVAPADHHFGKGCTFVHELSDEPSFGFAFLASPHGHRAIIEAAFLAARAE